VPPPAAPIPAAAPAQKPVEAKPVAAPAPASMAKTAEPVKLAETPPAPRKSAKAEDEGKPELLKKPKGGKGDDLKLIWGVGPKLEKMLNGMGVWHFDQIAAWTAKELAWIDARLEGFKGRARRDDWVAQCKKLAKGWRPDSDVGEKPKKK
jgi:NADH-quinone oxidoreductase subunit E